MEFSYQQYYHEMNRIYLTVFNWPQPYQYQQWYLQLSEQHQRATVHPSYYTQIYSYAIQSATIKSQGSTNKAVSLSRNQKRKKKKLELQQQLSREQKAIGDWVRLQRKDLIEGLQRIEKKEQKMKKKKEDKLKHLIEINKEVSKHYSKKQNSHGPINRRVKANSKKRVSYVKKLKQVFEKNKHKFIGLTIPDQEWQSDSDKEQEKKQQEKKEHVLLKEPQVVKEIAYHKISKLTGVRHNNVALRQWVKNCPSETLDDLVLKVTNRLAYKQAIRRVQRPDKAKKLIVSGIKECKRTLTTIIDKKRAKILIIALNIERNPYKGGVDDQVQGVIELAQTLKIPIIHSCNRSHLGRAFTGKWGPRITMVSIINYQGYQDMIEEMMKEWQKARNKYDQLP